MNGLKRIAHLLAVSALALASTTFAAKGREAYVMNFDGDWNVAGGLPEKAMLVSLQGLTNRDAPHLYIVHPPDFQWEITDPLFDFYERKHHVDFTKVATADEALSFFKKHAKGFVVWDKTVGASLNVAFTTGGLKDAIVVSEDLIPLAKKHGLKQIDDLRGGATPG